MKNALLSLALAATIALVGCNGFAAFFQSQNPPGGGTGTSTTSGLFYVLNYTAGEIVGEQVTNDALGQITNGSIAVTQPTCIAITPNNAFMYVGTSAGINYYSISSAGVIAQVNTLPLGGITTYIQSLQVDSTNGWLIVAQQGSAEILAIPLETTGTTIGAPSTTGTTYNLTLTADPKQLVISPDNHHIFAAIGTSGTDEILFTASNTTTSPLGAVFNQAVNPTGGTNDSAVTVAVSPSSLFLYVGEIDALPNATDSNFGGLRVFSINSTTTNSLTEQSGSPYASGGTGPSSILADHSGLYVYVANLSVNGQSSGNIMGYGTSVTTNASGSTETLAGLKNTPYSAGTTTNSLAEDNTYSFIIAVNTGGAQDIDVYAFDTVNLGALDEKINTSTGTDPTGAIAVATEH